MKIHHFPAQFATFCAKHDIFRIKVPWLLFPISRLQAEVHHFNILTTSEPQIFIHIEPSAGQ